MKIRILIFIFVVTSALCACSLFESSCIRHVSDNYVFRASVEVQSSNLQLAQEKAANDARRNIMEQIDAYIAEKFSYRNFLSDDNYEKKIDLMRMQILDQCETSCSHMSQKSGKIQYSTTFEISRSHVDEIINSHK